VTFASSRFILGGEQSGFILGQHTAIGLELRSMERPTVDFVQVRSFQVKHRKSNLVLLGFIQKVPGASASAAFTLSEKVRYNGLSQAVPKVRSVEPFAGRSDRG